MIQVVGLGPAGIEYVLPVALSVLEAAPEAGRFLRTERHPAAEQLARQGMIWQSFDEVYDGASSLDEAYATIVDRLIAAASAGDVVYAVPGSPVVAERTVALLSRHYDGPLHVVPGMSFADLAWARVMVDPMQGATVLDGHTLDEAALQSVGGPTLIAQVDSQGVLDDVISMLSLLLDDDGDVTILQGLGLSDERVMTMPLGQLSQRCNPDHLTSLFVDLDTSAERRFTDLVELTHRLRGPGGCPWDAAQTHQSLTRYLLEESYEVLDAIGGLPVPAPPIPPWSGDYAGPSGPFLVDLDIYRPLQSELGDVLFQVLFHAELAREAGAFEIGDVMSDLSSKLIRRHPHVFGDVTQSDSAGVEAQWEEIKKQERGVPKDGEANRRPSVMDGIPGNLPALLTAAKVIRKAAAVGDPAATAADGPVVAALTAEASVDGESTADAVARALLSIVMWGRGHDVDSETALMASVRSIQERVRSFEDFAAQRGVDPSQPGEARDFAWGEFDQLR